MGNCEWLDEGDVVIAGESFKYFNALIDENPKLKQENTELKAELDKYKNYVENLPGSLKDYQHESGNDCVDIEKFIEVQKEHFSKGE